MFNVPGHCHVMLHVPMDNREAIIRAGFTISSRERILASLRDDPTVAEVWKIYPAMLAAARKAKPAPQVVDPDLATVELVAAVPAGNLAASVGAEAEDESGDEGAYNPESYWSDDEGDADEA
jgi:hypothetical protein